MHIFNNTVLLTISLVAALSSVSTYSMDIRQAAETGNIARIQELIAAGANVNQANIAGRTPLHLAALTG